MSDTIEETPVVSMDEVSIARLHGKACWVCGNVSGTLTPSGNVRVAGGERVWTVSRCTGCRPQVAS